MKLGVIGAMGQVGSEFAKHISPEQLSGWGHDAVDVLEPERIAKALDSARVDAVVNLAAFHNTNACEQEQAKAFALNATGAYNVAREAAQRGIKAVFVSTDYVFGLERNRQSPYVESDRIGPLNVYGASKVAGESLVRAVCPNHLIVRTSSLFGASTSRKGWTFPEMIANKARAGQPLKVVSDQVMAPTYTYDLAARILELLEKDATGTVHITNGGQCSWHEFATKTLALLGIDYPIAACGSDAFPSPARRPSYSAMASERMSEFGLAPMRSWPDALRAYLAEKRWI